MGKRKYGYIDTTGKMVIDEDYDYATQFSGGCALVVWDNYNSFGLIDPEGYFNYEYENSN